MSDSSTPLDRLGRALANPSLGVLGLVDELLAVASQQAVRLDWQAGRCRVSSPEGGPLDRIDVPLQKSVVRAVLARVAALCNERNPDSVSPYGGQGEISMRTDPSKTIQAMFVNTPEEQRVDMTSMRPGTNDRSQVLSLATLDEARPLWNGSKSETT